MSYPPEPGRDPRPAPWASPSTTDPQDTQRLEDPPTAGRNRADHPGGYPADQPQPAGPWGPVPPPVPPQRTERRGPGWAGVIAVGAGAALLSSLLTIGIAENRLDSTSASQTTSSSSGGSSTGST